MENDKFLNIGKNFYEWYKTGKLKFNFNYGANELKSEFKRVVELIEYVEEKKRLKG